MRRFEAKHLVAGCISKCRLHADHHGPHDTSWKYLLPCISETDSVDDLDVTSGYREMA